MLRLAPRLALRVHTTVILGWRRGQHNGFHNKLSQFIIPKSNRQSIKPLTLPAELHEPGVRRLACDLNIPSLVRSPYIETSPAFHKWFKHGSKGSTLNTTLFKDQGGSTLVPLEYMGFDPESGIPIFKRFEAPLATFASFVEAPSPKFNLYLAQCDFDSFPESLRKDLTYFPRFLKKYTTINHVYGRNIWIGTPPTYTPLHRDPNHNYFQQLASEKKVRLMSPEMGLKVYSKLASKESNDWASGADPRGRIRTEEMMASSQRQDLYQAVWENQDPEIEIYEGKIERGQSVFIPAGWWHSFKSEGHNSISASINYWFQFHGTECGALRDLRMRRHKARDEVSLITRNFNPSLRVQFQLLAKVEQHTGQTAEEMLGDAYQDVMDAERHYRQALRKWGYRSGPTSDFQRRALKRPLRTLPRRSKRSPKSSIPGKGEGTTASSLGHKS